MHIDRRSNPAHEAERLIYGPNNRILIVTYPNRRCQKRNIYGSYIKILQKEEWEQDSIEISSVLLSIRFVLL